MRALLGLILALILGLGSLTEAVARSEMAGQQGQVICGAEGTTSVWLDGDGKPVARHPCTHCLAAGLWAALPTGPSLTAPAARWSQATPPPAVQAPSLPRPAALARGPPPS